MYVNCFEELIIKGGEAMKVSRFLVLSSIVAGEMKKLCVCLLATTVFLPGIFGLNIASAAEITFYFTGTVNYVGPGMPFDNTQTLTGWYSFESTTPDIDPDDPTWARYVNAITSFSFTVGSYTGGFNSGQFGDIGVLNDYLVGGGGPFSHISDEYWADCWYCGPDLSEELPFMYFVMILSDSTAAALSDESLQLTPPDVSSMDYNHWTLNFDDSASTAECRIIGIGCFVDGQITDIGLSPCVVMGGDTDEDGVCDPEDICPDEDATGFDANNDGCVDDLGGLIEFLGTLVAEGVIAEELKNSLITKVENAEHSADKENICAAINKLEALLNEVNAQRGKKISDEAANEIIAYTESVIANFLSRLPAGESC
jgi:hypothetical protein